MGNGSDQSSNGKLPDGLLSRETPDTLLVAQVLVEPWR